MYRFGQFELRPGSGELLWKGHAVRLPEQPLQILLALVERPGEVISREVLCARLWPEGIFVDFERGLNTAMKRLRDVLSDDAEDPRFVETLPKRGYRLLMPVVVESMGSPLPANPEVPQATPSGSSENEDSRLRPPAPPGMLAKVRRPAWLFSIAAVLVITALIFSMRWTNAPKPVRRYSIVLPQDAPVAPASMMPLGVGRPDLAISRDGEQIVYTGVTGTTTQLFLRTNAGEPPHPLPGTEGGHSPFLSPDNQWVGFFADSKLKKIRIAGGPAITLCDVVLGFGGSWVDDDNIYFTPGERTSIYRISASGGAPVQITPKPELPYVIGTYRPTILPNGKGILFGNSRNGIGVYSFDSGKYEFLNRSGSSPRWSPSGHVLYVQDGLLWALSFDPVTLKAKGSPMLVLDHIKTEQQGAAQFDISTDGTLVYEYGGDATEASFVWVNAVGETEDLGLPPKRYGEFQLSPDGKTLAVVIRNGPRTDLWSYDLERKMLTRLTDVGITWAPLWSPDSSKIVYASSSSGNVHLVEISADGSHKRVIPIAAGMLKPTQFSGTRFSPDGMAVTATGEGSAGYSMYLIDIKSGQSKELERSPSMRVFPSLSPDGHWLAYVSDETGQWEIYIRAMDSDERRWRITTAGGEEPIWDRSGRRLFFRNGDRWMRVDMSFQPEFRASQPVQVLQGPYVNIPGYSYDIAPDGRFLVLKSESQDKKTYQLEIVENWPSLLTRNTASVK